LSVFGVLPRLPQAGHSHDFAIAHSKGERLLVGHACLAPLEETASENQATPVCFPCSFKAWLCVNAIGPRIERAETAFHFFRPGRD
jgi:hypothetical protein